MRSVASLALLILALPLGLSAQPAESDTDSAMVQPAHGSFRLSQHLVTVISEVENVSYGQWYDITAMASMMIITVLDYQGKLPTAKTEVAWPLRLAPHLASLARGEYLSFAVRSLETGSYLLLNTREPGFSFFTGSVYYLLLVGEEFCLPQTADQLSLTPCLYQGYLGLSLSFNFSLPH